LPHFAENNMANSGAIRAGRAFVELFGDDSKLVRMLKGAETKVKAFGTGLMAMGGKMFAGGMALAAPLAAAVKQFTDYGSQLNDMSARTGVSVEALSEFGYAAQLSGADLETLEGGIRKMQKALGGVDGASKDVAEALASIGLNMQQLAAMNPEQKFMKISEKINGIESPTRRAVIAMAIFGKSGTMLLPMMDGLAETRKEAERLGLTMSTADAAAADTLGDTMDTLWASIKGVANQIGAALAPSLTSVLSTATEYVAQIIAWVRENRGLIVTIGKVTAFIVAAGAAMVALGAVVYGIGAGVGILATVFGAVLSPLGLLIGGLVALGAYFVSTGDAGTWVGSILSWLGDNFGWLKDTALAAWGAITGAIASGDIGAAFNLAWATIKMYWAEGVAWLTQKWLAFKGLFLQIWSEAVYGTATFMVDAWAGMQRTWVSIVSAMKTVWAEFTTWAGNLWNSMQQGVGNVFLSALEKVGVLTADEAKSAKADMNKTLESQKQDRTAANDEYLRQIDAEEAKQKDAITANQKLMDDALASDQAAKDKARQDGINADAEASRKAADAARAEWDTALAAAGVEAGAGMPGGPGKPQPFAGSDVTGQMKTKVTSTFNAFALSGMGPSNSQEETAKNTRETARILRRFEIHGMDTTTKATA
jgi:hypothetical protein